MRGIKNDTFVLHSSQAAIAQSVEHQLPLRVAKFESRLPLHFRSS